LQIALFRPLPQPNRNCARATPTRTLEKVPFEELQAIALRVKALGYETTISG